MNTTFCFGRRFLSQSILTTSAAIAFVTGALAEPRDTLPPWPEQTLGSWGFDHWYAPLLPTRTAIGIESAQMAESWSGYSLTRDLLAVSPVAIPVIDPNFGKRNFTTAQGTVRFWFRPDWSSAGAEGKGPGNYARLLELVSLSGKESEVLYSLYLSPEGNVVFLSGQGVRGPADFLKAEVNWQAGQWHLIALAYDEMQTTLFVDAVPVATGTAMPDVAQWKRDALGLVIGSDLAAGNPALGQFDELCTFDLPLNADDLTWYWKAYRWTVALGPVGTEKEELKKAEWLQAMWQAESGGTNAEPPQSLAYRTRPEEYPTNALWLDIGGVTNDVLTMRLQGTVPDTLYEILSKEDLGTNAAWQSEGVWIGTEGQDWTETPVSVGTRTNQLFMWARSYQDSTGSGMPDWWQMQNFGQVGVDGYGDPDGDGWANIQEYQNGTSPTAFNTPAAPQGIVVHANSAGTVATVSWFPASGAATNYVVQSYFSGITNDSTVTGTTFGDATLAVPSGNYYTWDIPSYRVRAIYYAGGSSEWSDWHQPEECLNPLDAEFVTSPTQGNIILASGLPSDAASVRFNGSYYDINSGLEVTTNFTIAAASFTNQITALPMLAQTNPFSWEYQVVRASGLPTVSSGYLTWGKQWLDAREHMVQNMTYFLRAACTVEPLVLGMDQWGFSYDFPNDYVYADFHWRSIFGGTDGGLAPWDPFYDNYALRNAIYSAGEIGTDGWLTTGFVSDWTGLHVTNPPAHEFSQGGRYGSFPALLSPTQAQWLHPGWVGWALGIGQGTNSTLVMTNNVRNYYGLRFLSAKVAWPGTPAADVRLLQAGGTTPYVNWQVSPIFYSETERPVYQNSGYYFGHVSMDPLPGQVEFSPTNATPILIASVGNASYQVAGYAKYAISNGYSGKFAYLGEYFDKAYKANTNGTRSTNATGFLSPYGEFFATEPGKVFLTTKPDGVSTNVGECVVNVIKLQLDVNHDGTMNTSWSGPDNTSQSKPFVFWVNNDYDRGHQVDCGLVNCDWEEDDLKVAGVLDYPTLITPDYAYATYAPFQQPVPLIPSMRDLEDYARLWLSGMSSLMAVMPTNYTVKLTLTGNAQIRIFRAVESDGGTNYLFNETTASNQVAQSASQFVGLLTSASPITLSGSTNFGERFIWCGAQRGTAEVHLQILDGNQNMLADTAAYIEIKDIKEMYERWTVGDKGAQPPTTFATNAVEDLPVGVPAYRYDPPTGTNTPYILHVHGWNMERWEKDRFGEAMFKRLYWQAYQGRFGIFRWPTETGLTSYDASEFHAWKSGTPLRQLLEDLDNQYPGQVRLTAHSMGNVAAGEALRTNVTLVHSYVAMQAAIPAHCFDANTTNRSLGLLDNGTPNRYAEYWTNGAPCYFTSSAGAGRYVNFFNKDDWALGWWELNQDTKPDTYYSWVSVPDEPERYYFQDSPSNIRRFYFPTNADEIFSFITEARCFALGAQTNVGGAFLLSEQTDLKLPPYEFGAAHKGHSAQFRSTNMKRHLFWERLLISLRLKELP